MERITTWVGAFLAALALTAGLAAPAAAQCPGDDGLTVPGACCVPTFPFVPAFPPTTIPGEGACFKDCNVEATFPHAIALGPAFRIFCDTYLVPINVLGGPLPGFLVGRYQRTWTEVAPTGATRQVWRLLVNADLAFPTGAVTPCPTPPCTLAGLPVHYIGSLDYTLDCGSGAMQAAINLTHLCGLFMHAPFSQRPLGGPMAHFDRSYSIVGPAPFAWGAAPVPFGPVIADAARTTDVNLFATPPLWNCVGETDVFNGNLTPPMPDCLCFDPATIPGLQWQHQFLAFSYGCAAPGVAFTLLPLPPVIPTGLTAMNLGTYTVGPTIYPAGESLSLYIGLALTTDPCTGITGFEIVTGVGTDGGELGILFPDAGGATITSDKFLDLENMRVLIPGAVPSTGIGSLFLSTQSWALNM